MTDTPRVPKTKCPTCQGDKVLFGLVKYAGSKPCEMRQLKCFTCRGEGEITEEHAKRIEAGRLMREDRLKRGLSQSEEAKRLGMAHMTYSLLEQGGF